MSDKRVFILAHPEARRRAMAHVAEAAPGSVVSVGAPVRSGVQNALLWALLGEVSEQVKWHGQTLQPGEWKDCFTAALKKQKVVPGIDGGFVVLGSSTSRMTKAELSELVEFIYAFGADHGVEFVEAASAESQ